MGIRTNQRRRTRKDLLEAAARLIDEGRMPTLEEVAAEALVARATAYRYFPNVEALLREAALDIAVPEPATLFDAAAPADPVARAQRVDTALHDMVCANESALRLMLAHTLERSATREKASSVPLRQNRRAALIDAALEPLAETLAPAAHDRLAKALGLLVGTEAFIACKDVLQLGDAEARAVKAWAIGALVEVAMKQSRSKSK
ncbi:TetR/AcrR family transcriptional regulator [Sphingopyxis alaskensis]|jgi:AcrR family transcriptional regulator|uniref:Transcriptional regulator, TetR family n=2 Tax=Sphingopyxis alaskensis TaxID=117207 RepID=Q1GPC8_SPHAL|nr:TetR/AcrR family transcriptional regulator [Sphingopyxis alaskensis]ABF54494.1 transcriptional regulator, TetR family [Sphingopyxis alaskensis RB2256]MCM3417781.1 TetR/AcrR family transcriptional regulator [Sphingopyxis alaskensis]